MQIRGKLQHRFLSTILIFALTISALTGCSSKKEDKNSAGSTPEATNGTEETKDSEKKEVTNLPLDTVLLTVDDKNYTIADFMYLIYSQEETFNGTANDYKEIYGIDFWDDVLDETTNQTGREMAEESTIETAKMLVFMKQQAEEAGYKLSSEEEDDIATYVQQILETTDEEHKKRTGFTEENLTTMIHDYMVATSYYSAQVSKESVDEKAIKDSIDYNDYKQREVEYVFIETVETDENGNEVEKSPEDVAELVKTANQILAKVKDGTAIEEAYESVVKDQNEEISHNTFSLADGDMDDELRKVVDSLKDGEYYDKLVETSGGYYIVKLLNSKSTELYDDTVQDQINTEKEDAFIKKMEKLYEKHNIIVNEEAWNQIVLGTYAYTQTEEAEIDDSNYFEESDSNGQDTIILPDDAADGDDGSVG